MKKLTPQEIKDADLDKLHEYGYWVDADGVATQVVDMPTRYLKNCLPFSGGVIRRYILGELNYRGWEESPKPTDFRVVKNP